MGTSNTGAISRNTTSTMSNSSGSNIATPADSMNGPDGGGGSMNDPNGLLSPGSQLDLVLSEVRRLEEMSNRYESNIPSDLTLK